MFLFWLRPESQYSEKSSAKTKKIFPNDYKIYLEDEVLGTNY